VAVGTGDMDIQPALGIRAGRHCLWQIERAHQPDGFGTHGWYRVGFSVALE
jgi:hypothetical protein